MSTAGYGVVYSVLWVKRRTNWSIHELTEKLDNQREHVHITNKKRQGGNGQGGNPYHSLRSGLSFVYSEFPF